MPSNALNQDARKELLCRIIEAALDASKSPNPESEVNIKPQHGAVTVIHKPE